MKLQVFAIKDRALNAFMQPFYAPTVGAAIRAFSDGLNDKQHAMNAHPDDYDIWHLGHWEDDTGHFVREPNQPEQVALGKNLIRKE